MLITVPPPHMVLNSHNVPEPDYEMQHSWKVSPGETVENMIARIRKTALEIQGGRLKTLIFNSHGSPGVIHIGQGIRLQDLHHFEWLKKDDKTGLIDEIWIVACQVAGIQGEVTGGASGDEFCKSMAKTTLSDVKAGVKNQYGSGRISIPPGTIDNWNGNPRIYFSNGVIFQRD
jgi:hypothetical protein